MSDTAYSQNGWHLPQLLYVLKLRPTVARSIYLTLDKTQFRSDFLSLFCPLIKNFCFYELHLVLSSGKYVWMFGQKCYNLLFA